MVMLAIVLGSVALRMAPPVMDIRSVGGPVGDRTAGGAVPFAPRGSNGGASSAHWGISRSAAVQGPYETQKSKPRSDRAVVAAAPPTDPPVSTVSAGTKPWVPIGHHQMTAGVSGSSVNGGASGSAAAAAGHVPHKIGDAYSGSAVPFSPLGSVDGAGSAHWRPVSKTAEAGMRSAPVSGSSAAVADAPSTAPATRGIADSWKPGGASSAHWRTDSASSCWADSVTAMTTFPPKRK